MTIGLDVFSGDISARCPEKALVEQIFWLIRLRWIAAGGIIAAALAGSYIFPVLISAVPIYICAGALLLCNIFYFLEAARNTDNAEQRHIILGIAQIEIDLVILTAALNFAGGAVNPFFLFYIFHVIIAAIILSRNLSFIVGLTAIALFGLLVINELNGGKWLGYYPLRFSLAGDLQRNPVYLFGEFTAFSCTVILARYLTRVIVVRMAAKEIEAAREHKKLEDGLREQTETVISINEMLKRSRIEMAQREKMVAIGQMAAGIAHEIGNPLTSLSSAAQYLARKVGTHEEKENFLIIEHQVDRISNILKRMLSLSRPAASEYKWVSINELIDNALSLVKFDKRMQAVAVRSSSEADLPMIWLNPQHFEQVLLNIFINAMDAMKAVKQKHEHVLEITQELKDAMIEIRISDTGVGMSPEVCKRAFESFFTTKEIGKGTGLGLFISYNLVTELGGTIELKSAQGKGTTVIICVPVRHRVDTTSYADTKSIR
ncbi:MAG: ATP-binding protein [Phycisphaerae bacterium]|jgi:signal transduction histidine kinase